jgi:hypothetical protein
MHIVSPRLKNDPLPSAGGDLNGVLRAGGGPVELHGGTDSDHSQSFCLYVWCMQRVPFVFGGGKRFGFPLCD